MTKPISIFAIAASFLLLTQNASGAPVTTDKGKEHAVERFKFKETNFGTILCKTIDEETAKSVTASLSETFSGKHMDKRSSDKFEFLFCLDSVISKSKLNKIDGKDGKHGYYKKDNAYNNKDGKYDDKYGGDYDDKYDGEYDDKYDDKYDGEYDDKYDGEYDGEYDEKKDGEYDGKYDDSYEGYEKYDGLKKRDGYKKYNGYKKHGGYKKYSGYKKHSSK